MLTGWRLEIVEKRRLGLLMFLGEQVKKEQDERWDNSYSVSENYRDPNGDKLHGKTVTKILLSFHEAGLTRVRSIEDGRRTVHYELTELGLTVLQKFQTVPEIDLSSPMSRVGQQALYSRMKDHFGEAFDACRKAGLIVTFTFRSVGMDTEWSGDMYLPRPNPVESRDASLVRLRIEWLGAVAEEGLANTCSQCGKEVVAPKEIGEGTRFECPFCSQLLLG